MTQYAIPVDVEAALASALGIAAPPVPAALAAPYSCVTSTGGSRSSLVVDRFFADVDCWGADEASALALARGLVARALELPGTEAGGATWCAVSAESLPYLNPDPDEPTLARATFSLAVTARSAVAATIGD